MAKANELIANYPPGRQASAVIGVLDLAQRQQGWLPRVAMDEVARILDMAPIRVYEIATFYTMFQLKPKGKYLLQVCTTTPCWLRGSEAVMKACQEAADGDDLQRAGGRVPRRLRERAGRADQRRFLRGSRRRLDEASVLDAFRRGETPKPGPQVDRQTSAPEGGPTTLKGE